MVLHGARQAGNEVYVDFWDFRHLRRLRSLVNGLLAAEAVETRTPHLRTSVRLAQVHMPSTSTTAILSLS